MEENLRGRLKSEATRLRLTARPFQQREHYKFETVGKVMRDLLEWRRQLVSGTLTQDQTRELKMKIIAKIDWGNR
jgi:dedicator of cytokinesis protein 3